VAYESGDTFLLCTDGLTEGLYHHSLADRLQAPLTEPVGNIAQLLVESAVNNDGRDNTTAPGHPG
jgi:protein phosphatase